REAVGCKLDFLEPRRNDLVARQATEPLRRALARKGFFLRARAFALAAPSEMLETRLAHVVALTRDRSIRPRHAEHVLAQEREDQVGRDRRDLHQPGLAPFALDVVLLGVTEAAVGLQRCLGRVPGSL